MTTYSTIIINEQMHIEYFNNHECFKQERIYVNVERDDSST